MKTKAAQKKSGSSAKSNSSSPKAKVKKLTSKNLKSLKGGQAYFKEQGISECGCLQQE